MPILLHRSTAILWNVSIGMFFTCHLCDTAILGIAIMKYGHLGNGHFGIGNFGNDHDEKRQYLKLPLWE